MSSVPPRQAHASRSALPKAFDQLRDRLRESPAHVVVALCCVQALLWTLIPALTTVSPLALPVDVTEGYLWGREWVLATYKHPALPSWVLEASRIVTGRIGWPAYLVSQLFIAATLSLIYLLGRETMDAQRGAAAALLMTGVFFFSWFSPEFNHNIAQMPFWIGVVWALWHATRANGLAAWLYVALFATACVYTKLSCAVLLVTAGLWLLWDEQARATLKTRNPWIALALFLVLTAPLMLWLWRNNFLPLDYAERRANSASSVSIPEFLIGQVGRHAGLLGLLAWSGLLWHSKRPAPDAAFPRQTATAARAYLLIMAIGPLLALIVASLVLGMQLKPAWTASMSTLSGLLAIALCSHRFTTWTYARLARGAAFALVVTVACFAYESLYGFRDTGRYRPQQAAFPADQIAAHALKAWADATTAPLRIVVGETRIAGLVALAAPSLPSLMTEADTWRSPWITPERLRREGALLVWSAPGGMNPDRLRQMSGTAPIRHVEIAWPRVPGKPPLQLYVAAVPPQPDAPGGGR